MMDSITRRGFLFAAASAAATAGPWRILTPAEATLCEAIAAHIIPADESPGAREAGVIHYIDQQLAGTLKRFAPSYREGLAAFARVVRRETGKDFTELDSAAQIAFLEAVEARKTAGIPSSFFPMVLDHTMQGFYGDPAHGGNRNAVSFHMLGIGEVMGAAKHGGAH